MLLARARAAVHRLCVVEDPLTVTEWARRFRVLPETSTSPGPYNPDITPYVRRPQDLMADPDVSTLVLCWAAQTTKSTVIENGILYRIARAPTPMVVVQPKIDAAEAWAKERLVPAILATEVVRSRVRLGRATDSTLRYKRFPGGFVFVASSQSAAELASRSAPFLALDEVDRMEPIAEGNPVEIAMRRQGAADVALAVLTSTPGTEESSIIWPYLEAGSYERYHVPCPVCGVLQPMVWPNLKWPSGRPDLAEYQCAECAAMWLPSSKRHLLHAGEWVASNPEATYPSFHLNALYSPFARSSWGALAAEFVRAAAKPLDLQVFVNTRLAEVWREFSEKQIDTDTLADRLEPMTEGRVPEGVGVCTLGVDVQANRLEWAVWGWGAGMESWLIAQGVIDGDPQTEPDVPGSVWTRLLQDVVVRRWPHARGGTVRIAAGGLDTGYATTHVYRALARLRTYRILGVKGVGGRGVAMLGKAAAQGEYRVPVYPLGVDALKTAFLRSELPTTVAGPGYVHLPDWITTEYLAQLVGEKRTPRIERGRRIYEWRPKTDSTPVEALDCRNYARAALESLGVPVLAKLGTMAATLGVPEGTDTPRPEPTTARDQMIAPRKPPRRRGWMDGYSL